MFKGTPTRSADDVNREFDEMGAHYNAFTSEENTVYYAAVLPEYQTPAVELLADILAAGAARGGFQHRKAGDHRRDQDVRGPAAVRGRRQVPGGRISAGIRWAAACWARPKASPACRSKRCARYFAAAISPGNIMLVGAGRDRFRRARGTWPKRRAAAGNRRCPARYAGRRRHAGASKWSTKAVGHAGIRCSNWPTAPRPTDDDRYAAKLLATILGDDSGSRLYWELVDPGLAEHASLRHYEYQGAGLFMTYLSCEPEFAADNLRASAEDLSPGREADGFTAAELDPGQEQDQLAGSCWGASGRAAGCSPSAAIGPIARHTAA